MLAYAAHRRQQRKLSPTALALIIGAHAAGLAVLVSARMDVGPVADFTPTIIENIPLPDEPLPPPPPPPEPQPAPRTQTPQPSHLDLPPPVIDVPVAGPAVDLGPAPTEIVPDIRPVIEAPLGKPVIVDPPKPAPPVRIAANLNTPADLLRPPYPESRRQQEVEAALRLRLSIDERGRVTAVEPVGAADPEFLASARRHLIRHWRYKPATEDGRPVPSTLVITLRFQLEDA